MKITTAVLAQKIADYMNTLQDDLSLGHVDPERTIKATAVLEAIPELAGFDTLADQVQTAFQDAQQALYDPEAYINYDNLKGTRNACYNAYIGAVGEAPEVPKTPEGVSMMGGVEEDLTAENDLPVDESNGEGGFELAPDESEQ